jgi:hypothetical protein
LLAEPNAFTGSEDSVHGSYVKKSLLPDRTTLGVDDWLLFMNVELAIFIVGILKLYQWTAVTVLAHFALVAVTHYQPRVVEVYWKFMGQRSRYADWSALPLTQGQRPAWLEALAGRTTESTTATQPTTHKV